MGNMPLGFVWSTGLGAEHRVQNGRYGSLSLMGQGLHTPPMPNAGPGPKA